MGSPVTFNLNTKSNDIIDIKGSFAPNSDATAVTATAGTGWSAARTSIGLFTVTLDDRYPEIVSVMATAQTAAEADTKAVVGDIVDGSSAANSVQIRWITTTSAVDVTADDNNRINFCITVRNSSLQK